MIAAAVHRRKAESKQNTTSATAALKGRQHRTADRVLSTTARGRGAILRGITTTVITRTVRLIAVPLPLTRLREAAVQVVRAPVQVPAAAEEAGTNANP